MDGRLLTVLTLLGLATFSASRGSRATIGPRAETLLPRVRQALTPDLVNRARCTPNGRGTSCHCYHASEALYHLLGGARSGYVPVHGPNPGGGAHWWLERRDTGAILDPTGDQFPGGYRRYGEGVRAGFLTKEPSRRARTVMARVQSGSLGVVRTGRGTRLPPEPSPDTRLADAVWASNALKSRIPGKPHVDANNAASILAWLRWNDRDGDYEDELGENLDDAQRTLIAAWPEDEVQWLRENPDR